MLGGRAASLAVLVLVFAHSPPAKAGIWGFVDSERIPHVASSPLDERYELFLRDSEAVEPFQRINAVGKAQDDSQEMPDAEPARPYRPYKTYRTYKTYRPYRAYRPYRTYRTGLPLAGTVGAGAVSPRLVAFFERSETYKAVSPLLREASKTHGIDYSLLKALIATESGFNTYAVSPKGAVGLMQLIPATAERYGVTVGKGITIQKKLTDPKVNIKAGARYLADLIKMFPGRLELALAAYNAGEGAVQRAGNKIPNYPETQKYVKTVMQLYTGLAPLPYKTPTGRVHVEIIDGSTGRGNMPPLIEPTPTLSSADFAED